MYGADPRLFHLGTKTGCRRLFEEWRRATRSGVEGLHTQDEVVEAVCRTCARAGHGWPR